MAELLGVQSVVKRFGGLVALDKVSIGLEEGKVYGLIGPNGSGKTTLLNLITAVLRPNSGAVLFKGYDITRKRPEIIARMGLARTFQIPRIFQNLSVKENMLAALPESASPDIVDNLLAVFGLRELASRSAATLDYSRKKLLELARAMTQEPSLIMLDEPMAGLDLEMVRSMSAYISEMNKKYGKTLLVVEHNLEELFTLTDSVFVLDHGTLIYEGSPDGIKESKAVVAAYFGHH